MDSHQISLFEEFDGIAWWNSLNVPWKTIFENDLLIITASIELKYLFGKPITASEKILLKYKQGFDRNAHAVKVEAIRYLLNSNDLILGNKLGGQDVDLTILRPFTKLEELTITDITNFNMQSFSELKSLKKINLVGSKIDKNMIVKLQEILPTCSIVTE